MTCIGYVTGFRFHSQGKQRRLLDFLSSDLCQLMYWRIGGPLLYFWWVGGVRRDQERRVKDKSFSIPPVLLVLSLPCSTSSLNLRLAPDMF